jgi:hypothetical protein
VLIYGRRVYKRHRIAKKLSCKWVKKFVKNYRWNKVHKNVSNEVVM